jgi:hypothetical protein
MDKREFWTTKNPGAQYETVAFSHPSFSTTFRLVSNVFATVTLGGNVYTPAPMQIKWPNRDADANPKLQLSFPRPVVGRQFKQQLKLVQDAGSLTPITVVVGLWLAEVDTPKVTWTLYAADRGGVNFGRETVQVVATLDNPLRRDVASIYSPETFTGLAVL